MINVGDKVLVKKYGEVLELMMQRKYYKNLKQRKEISAIVAGKICTVTIINQTGGEAAVEVDEMRKEDKVSYALPIEAIEDKDDPNYWAKVLANEKKKNKAQVMKYREKIRNLNKERGELIKEMYRLTSNYVIKISSGEPYDAEEEELMNYITKETEK